MSPNDLTVKKDKAEQLDKVFKHLKQAGDAKALKGMPGLDPALVAVLSKLDEKELQALSKLNDELFDAGFGVSGEFRVSMV